MARQPRRLMRQGVADLLTRAQVDAYTGPNGEVISDGETLRLHDGAAPGGIPIVSLKSKILSSAAGAVPVLLTDVLFANVHAVIFGVQALAPTADPSLRVSQTAAMRRAITAAQARGARLILPEGQIWLGADPSDTEAVLRITLLMSMQGASANTRFMPLPSVGDRTILLIKPFANNGGINGMTLREFSIGIPGVPREYGGDAIRVDTSNLGGFVSKLLIENVGTSSRGLGYYGFRHINPYTEDGSTTPPTPLTGNVNGGLFASTIRDCVFTGGMRFEQTGDSNNIERCLINGPNEGIYYQAIGGAATARIVGCNITATGDTIVIDGGQQIYILENQLEAVGVYTGSRTNPAVVTVIAAVSVAIRNNNINAYSRADAVSALGGAQGVLIEANTVNYAANKLLFRAVASPNNCVGRQLYEGIGGSPKTGQSQVSVDAASPTFGVWQPLTLQNGWNTTGTDANFRQGLWWMPLIDGTIRLSGSIANGATAGGTLIATLPANFRPFNIVRFMGLAYLNNLVNGSPWTLGIYLVNTLGEIRVQFLPTLGSNNGTFLSFDSTSFSIRQ